MPRHASARSAMRSFVRSRSTLLACVLAVGAAWSAPGWAAQPQTRPTVEDYMRTPAIGSVALSPSGRQLAMTLVSPKGRLRLAVMALPAGEPRVIADFDDADVQDVRWINDERLLFEAVDNEAPAGQRRSSGVFAIQTDGSRQRQIITQDDRFLMLAAPSDARVLTWEWSIHSIPLDGSADVLVTQDQWSQVGQWQSRSLWRLNTLTGIKQPLGGLIPSGAAQWLVDRHGEPRVILAAVDAKERVYRRDAPDGPWKMLAEFNAFGAGGFVPWFLEDERTLYVLARRDRDHEAIYRYDLESRTLDKEPTVALKGFDLRPGPIVDRSAHKILGLRVDTEQPGTFWFDKELRALQEGIDAALPAGRVNRLICTVCKGAPYLVVWSGSDQQPGEYHIVDLAKGTFTRLGATRPWLDPARQGQRSFQWITARDGRRLPVYLTRPAGTDPAKALPAVVLVHGGPWVRGHDLMWGHEAQFLASRGYLVIETEFRGSTGYGHAHYRAGFKQWGLAMQDDLADSVQWAATQGWVDPKRVCIAGASYGGYAALMGPIRHPEVYRCAVSYAGVTDIELMYSIHWSDLSDPWRRHGMPRLIGDRVKDAAQLAETSPLKQVRKIRVPVLLGHGARDVRVPIEHSSKFVDEARFFGVPVESVEYDDEGHGLHIQANRVDFWRRVEAFLERSLAPARQP